MAENAVYEGEVVIGEVRIKVLQKSNQFYINVLYNGIQNLQKKIANFFSFLFLIPDLDRIKHIFAQAESKQRSH